MFSVEENARDSLVGKVVATDVDIGVNQDITFTIVNGDNAGLFRIDPVSGKVYTSVELNREAQGERLNVTVLAMDAGSPSRNTTCTVSIRIIDMNDNTPIFTQPSIVVKVNEHTTPVRVVQQFIATDGDAEAPSNQIFYSLTSTGDDAFRQYFAIHNVTGKLSLVSAVDYEAHHFFNFRVTASNIWVPSAPRSSFIEVMINITDYNDTPLFDQAVFHGTVNEAVAQGVVVFTVHATDLDSTLNKYISYEIVNSTNSAFKVTAATGELMATQPLDRETFETYTIYVRARDAGVPQLASVAKVVLVTLDSNDNTPIISPSSYTFELAENRMGTNDLGTVTATDADKGENARLTFEVVAASPKPLAAVFSADMSTGIIRVTGPLNREDATFHILTVLVSDLGVPNRSSTCQVVVNVLDTNDNSPVFDPASYYVEMREHEAGGYAVVNVNASDNDEGKNGEIIYSITGGDPQNEFSVDSTTGAVTTVGQLDRENTEFYSVVVTATDQSPIDPKATTANVTIVVIDVNDHDPVFSPSVYSVDVLEDVPLETEIVTVVATDADKASFASITFSIVGGNEKGLFKVHPSSGTVSSIGAFDRERAGEQSYVLTVMALDGGGRSATAALSVTILDVNDNDPYFSLDGVVPESTYIIYVHENAAVGTEVLDLDAYDADQGVNQLLRYSLPDRPLGPAQLAFPFAINSVSGSLSLAVALDRERYPTYNIIAQAQDAGVPFTRNETTTVLVIVIDHNDNAPVFNKSNYTTKIMENGATGTEVTTILATDIDHGTNGKVEFSIGGGDTYGNFQINSVTGVVTILMPPDREVTQTVKLIIIAADTAPHKFTGPDLTAADLDITSAGRKSTATFLIVTILDQNDNHPIFTQTLYSCDLVENPTLNQAVFQVSASDKDVAENSTIVYTIANAGLNLPFRIDPDSGVIAVSGVVDREQNESFFLTIVATDQGASPGPHSTSSKVTITVLDMNDNPPVFDPSTPASITVLENTTAGTVVLTLEASDKDLGSNFMFSLLEVRARKNNGGEFLQQEQDFEIGTRSGEFTIRNSLDRESIDEYTIVIEVIDNIGGNTATHILDLIVLDVNDNDPLIGTISDVVVPEGAGIGYIVSIVNVSDRDIDQNGKLYYTLKVNALGGNASDLSGNEFEIDANGVITVANALNREAIPGYTLAVTVSDGGIPTRATVATFTVLVGDENDNEPVLLKTAVVVSMSEGADLHTLIHQVVATDADAGKNSELRYIILSGNDDFLFKLDLMSGNLTVARALDREKWGDSHKLTIQVQDLGFPAVRASTGTITVLIEDENDNAPQFSQADYGKSISESVAIGTLVIRVSASDLDASEEGKVVYTLLNGDGSSDFILDANTGDLRTAVKMDFDTVPTY
jgi:hypothetical protein